MAANNTEDLGIRIRADGVLEATNGVALTGKAVEELGKKLDAAGKPLKEHDEAVARTGNTAKQTAAAYRLLPAQITDVVTSLASGQPAWLVAIQQGGQIKDSFGGIGPMFRELSGALTLGRVAFGGAALAVGTLVVAYERAQREAQGYSNALIMNRNAAGTTANQMTEMARAISASIGTQGKAAESLTSMASSGEVARANLQEFADLGVRMERTLGTPLDDTAQRFTELGRAPLEASLRLNRGVNYLTASVYEQIRALMAEGKVTEAGAVAQQAYAEAMRQRTAQVNANLGTLQTATTAVGDAFKKMWDKILDVGREETLDDKIKKARQRIAELQPDASSMMGRWAALGDPEALAARKKQADEAKQQLNELLAQKKAADDKGTADAAEVARRNKALRDQQSAAIEAANALDLARAQAAATEREALVARELAQAQAAATRREALLRTQTASLEDLRERDGVSLYDYYQRKAALEQRGLQSEITTIDSQIQAEQKLLAARQAVLAAQLAAEQRRKPENENDTAQQQARIIGLNAQKQEMQLQSEARLIDLRAQRGRLTAEQTASEVAAQRNIERASAAATEQLVADVAQRRTAMAQLSEQMRVSNAAAAVDLIADPYQRATEQAKLSVAELTRSIDQQIGGLRARLPQLEVSQPDAAKNARAEIVALEQQKADAIVLINRRLTEDLKPEWQQQLEAWRDTTRLMRESYDQFQNGWLQSGKSAWADYFSTGKLSLGNLKTYAMSQLGEMTFKRFLAEPFAKMGDSIAGFMGMGSSSAASLGGSAATQAALAEETSARTLLTTAITEQTTVMAEQSTAMTLLNTGMAQQSTAMTVQTTAMTALTSAATSAAAALAMVSASGGSAGGGGLLSLVSGGNPSGSGTVTVSDIVALDHTGSIAGMHEASKTSVPQSIFAGARRLHTGGLAADEVPAVLQRTEGVFTKGQMAAMAPVDKLVKAAGSGSTVHFSPQINIDARTDKAEVLGIVQGAMKTAQAQLLDMMDRRQV